jgi:cytochrome c oxidase cbb3-type subunit III
MIMKTLNLIIVLSFFSLTGWGQGEGLFKAKCSVCHNLEKNSTGPMLQGVKQKWTDAGEGELIYEWVKNSSALIASGKSKMATEIEKFSPSVMSAQELSKDEVDQVLAYVDGYVKTPVNDTTGVTTTTNAEVTLIPNYEQNLTIFYILIFMAILLIVSILVMSNNLKTFVRSDFFVSRMKEKEEKEKNDALKNILPVILIGLCFAIPADVFALSTSTPEEFKKYGVWTLISNTDLWVFSGINLVLLFLLMYLKNLFNNFYYMVVPRKEKKAKPMKALTKTLTDAVPIEEEKSILMDHEYDGIRELDNNLPPWWIYGFYCTIIFAVAYLVHYHVLKTGNTQAENYKIEMVTAQKEVDEYLKSQAMNVDETNVTKLEGAEELESGKGVFTSNCTACHKEGQGDIGPNLTDKFWLYGNDIKNVFATIKNGTPNGMPEHASKLNPIQIQQVASYVLSLKYKAGREPQGKEVK